MYVPNDVMDELQRLFKETNEELSVFFYHIVDFIKNEVNKWVITDYEFCSRTLSPSNPKPSFHIQRDFDSDDYMERLYDFWIRTSGYHESKNQKVKLSNSHHRTFIIDYIDRKKAVRTFQSFKKSS